MDPFVVLLVLGSATWIWFGLEGQRLRMNVSRAALAACGVTHLRHARSLGWISALHGLRDGLPVRVESLQHGTDDQGVHLSISGLPSITLAARAPTPSDEPGSDLTVGDAAFDDAVQVQGPPELVHALLDGETRERVLRLLSGTVDLPGPGGARTVRVGARVTEGVAHLVVLERALTTVDRDLPGVFGALLDLAAHLARPIDVARQLSQNARHDPQPLVRIANLLLLTPDADRDALVESTLEAACGDPDENVRLRAAELRGPAGRATLLALAAATSQDACCARAAHALGGALPAPQARALLADALERGRRETALACMAVVASDTPAEALPILLRALASPDAAIAASGARALGTLGQVAAEEPLISSLQAGPEEVRVAAAESLGGMGTAAAVMPLMEAAERNRGALRRAARTAVVLVRERLSGAAPGQLSVASGEAGLVSLPPGEAGAVTLPAVEPEDIASRERDS